MDREWELRAACRSQDPDIWFSKGTWKQAKAICLDECPVREACLEATLAREAQTADTLRAGIMAGLTGAERAALARSRMKPEVKKPKPKRTPGAGRRLAPCGTESAYSRHQRKGEPIDQACREAHAQVSRHYRRTGSKVVAVR
ncbi:MAG: WhiB family transcriptional regulator [Streptomyces sp.]|nr:WhiB family transcriptional regulator [Streptomyces sp.]